MDLYRAIHTLYEEKKRLDRLIQSLEKIQARATAVEAEKPKARRGRRGMSAEERREVSERMKRYWASRRSAEPSAAEPEPAQASAAVAGASASTPSLPDPVF